MQLKAQARRSVFGEVFRSQICLCSALPRSKVVGQQVAPCQKGLSLIMPHFENTRCMAMASKLRGTKRVWLELTLLSADVTDT